MRINITKKIKLASKLNYEVYMLDIDASRERNTYHQDAQHPRSVVALGYVIHAKRFAASPTSLD
jgi:hypothetical protein